MTSSYLSLALAFLPGTWGREGSGDSEAGVLSGPAAGACQAGGEALSRAFSLSLPVLSLLCHGRSAELCWTSTIWSQQLGDEPLVLHCPVELWSSGIVSPGHSCLPQGPHMAAPCARNVLPHSFFRHRLVTLFLTTLSNTLTFYLFFSS